MLKNHFKFSDFASRVSFPFLSGKTAQDFHFHVPCYLSILRARTQMFNFTKISLRFLIFILYFVHAY